MPCAIIIIISNVSYMATNHHIPSTSRPGGNHFLESMRAYKMKMLISQHNMNILKVLFFSLYNPIMKCGTIAVQCSQPLAFFGEENELREYYYY